VIYSGQNYQLIDSRVLPNSTFIGELQIPVTVKDDIAESEQFILKVSIIEDSTNKSGDSSSGCFLNTLL